MLYDYHWDSSKPGSLAPIGWVRSVLKFAVTQIPPPKLVLGLGTYGYDWVGDRGTSLMWDEIRALARETRSGVRWDEESASPWFRYVDAGDRVHEVWFENAASIHAKSAVAEEFCIGGVHLWRLGGADPALWQRR